MKTILVPTESHEAIRPALETALMLARRFDSYIEGFALRFRVNEFVARIEGLADGTFFGEIESRAATRETFLPSRSQTRGITISANSSVIC